MTFISLRRAARLLLPALLAAMLAACGGDDDDGEASVRLVNATADAASLDLTVENDDDDADEARFTGDVARDAQSDYQTLADGTYTLRVKRAGASSSLAVAVSTLEKDQRYTLFAYGREGNYRLYTALDDEDEPSSGKARVRVFNAAADAGTVDVYLTNAHDSLADALATASNVAGQTLGTYGTVDQGTYRIRVTGVNDRDDIRLDVPAIELADRARVTIVLQPGPGGVLVNALVSQYQGELSAWKNTHARVRLVAGASGNAAVTAAVGDTPLNNALRSPSVGSYALVPAGTAAASIEINNAALAFSGQVTLAAGGDYTLAVYGDAAAPVWRLIADDNRPPASNERAKMRLLHMAAGADTNLTLLKDYLGIANDVAYGNASTYAEVASSASSRVEVTSPLSAVPLFLNDEVPLSGRGVFTVFMLGGAASPTGILRRER